MIIVKQVTVSDGVTDLVSFYYDAAKKEVKVNDLINVFDKVRTVLGLRLIFAKQLAKCALSMDS